VTSTKTVQDDISTAAKDFIDTIRSSGDVPVRKYSEKFDNWSPLSFKLSKADIDAAISTVPD
jgi:histidinol dehydrogenase